MKTGKLLLSRISSICQLAVFVALAFAIIFVPTNLWAQETTGYRILHEFTGGEDGGYPYSGLIDAWGSLYGSTCGTCAQGYGTIYKLDRSGKKVLYTFSGGDDGMSPGGLVAVRNKLYGTTYWGGTYGIGTLFSLDQAGKLTVLHTFSGPDGSTPSGTAGLTYAAGSLYGTTTLGGTYGQGTVFELDKTGAFQVLYSFSGGADGGAPWAGVVLDGAGNIYGTTQNGGSGRGVVFKLDPSGNETVLHSFQGPEGGYPISTLTWDPAGNLYGTAYYGGSHGVGTVFELDPNGTLTVLYNFAGPDGAYPGSLMRDEEGNLYGTTAWGGAYNDGTVFELDANGQETVLHDFYNNPDGIYPSSRALVRGSMGNFYGTTGWGGTYGIGMIFQLMP